MSIKLMMEIERAHNRIDVLEKVGKIDLGALETLLVRLDKAEGEIKAMKARMGKVREVAEI